MAYAGQKPLNAAWIQDVAEVTTKRYAIFNTNKMDRARAFDGAGGVTVYPLFSRVNHSCVPNVQNIYNASLQRLIVYAIRDIQAEEQVFVAYFKTAFRTL
jgi:SET domain-containing protein